MAALSRRLLSMAMLLGLAAPAASLAQAAAESETAAVADDQPLPETPEAELAYARAAGIVFASVDEGPRDKVNTSDQLSCDSKMAKLLDDPNARGVLERRIPEVVADPRIFMARGLTLKQLAKHKRAGITPEVMAEIDQDLASATSR